MLRRKGETQHHEENVEQAHPADVIERLEGQTAAVIIGVAACVVVGEDVGHHRPEQDDHRHDGRKAEEDEVFDSDKDGVFFAALRQPHTARDEQQRVGEVVAHHKVEVPPAGEDDGGSGQKMRPNRTGSSLSNRKSSVSRRIANAKMSPNQSGWASTALIRRKG